MPDREAGFEIVIAGRSVKWPRYEIKYDEAKQKWDELSPDRTIIGDPAINYNHEGGERGMLLPGESIKVEDGLVLKVDPAHLS